MEAALVSGFVNHLGSEGNGPLGRSVSATFEGAAASAADGVLNRLLPQCGPDDPRCLDRRLAEISQSLASGVVRGMRESIQLGLLIAAFLAGVVCATIVSLAVALHRRPRATDQSGGEHGQWAVKTS